MFSDRQNRATPPALPANGMTPRGEAGAVNTSEAIRAGNAAAHLGFPTNLHLFSAQTRTDRNLLLTTTSDSWTRYTHTRYTHTSVCVLMDGEGEHLR